MNDELKMNTFVVESMTVEAGRIIPSPALAEAVIGGIAQIIAERDELRAECDAAQAEAARLQALWDSVPWRKIKRVLRDAADTFELDAVDEWYADHAPKPQDKEPQP